MEFDNFSPRPVKKRRFFEELNSEGDSAVQHESSDQNGKNSVVNVHPATAFGIPNEANPLASSHEDTSDSITHAGFDNDAFEAIVGEPVAPSVLRKLREVSGDNTHRAVNMYFDGSWRTMEPSVSPAKKDTRSFGNLDVYSRQKLSNTAPTISPLEDGTFQQSKSSHKPSIRPKMPEKRYLGAFGVGGWATRSGANMLKHGEVTKIERQKIKPPVKSNGKASSSQASANLAANKRGDIIVRFTNSRGEEIGRLPKETAAWVSTLIDQKLCSFEGTCVFAPDRIRINDTIYLQLRCSALRSAFYNSTFKTGDNNRTTGIYEAKETEDEKELRLRQVALVKLFEEIDLNPTTASKNTARQKRQSLLQAAEVAEQNEKSSNSAKVDAAPSSPESSEEAEDGKELEQDQLDALYKKAQSFDFNTPSAEPAETFTMDLRQYQKQALHWMMAKENDKDSEKGGSLHPLWEEYTWPSRDVDDKPLDPVANVDKFYINSYSGELSLDFPVQEQNCLGGILADEMGLGKTIEMLSLMHTNRSEIAAQNVKTAVTSIDSLPRLPTNSSSVQNAPCTTLVIAPMSLLAQWQSEAEKASVAGTMKSLMYYGSDKSANLQSLCCEANAATAPNIVITSYGVVLSEFNQVAASKGNRGSHGGLFSLNFFRIILDEAHHIKNRQSKTAKACYELEAQHRWVLTGTPIVNRLEDLFSLVRFLRVEPWSNFSFWKTFITTPFESKDFIRALDVVQTVLEPLVLRRTKDMKTPDGKALVPLPPRTIHIEDIELSKAEREVYDHIFTRAKRTFAANVEAGTLLKSYTTIFAQILRLRQSCCHPILTRNKNIVEDEELAAAAADVANGLADDMDLQALITRFTADMDEEQDANKFGAHVLQQISDEAGSECPICCEEPMIDQAVTGCWHSACKHCLLDYIEHQKDNNSLPRCFNCREPINQRDIFEVVRHDHDVDFPSKSQAPRVSLRRIGNLSSAKISALVNHLKRLRREEDSSRMKSVVFSQFTSFLDLIEPELKRDNIRFLRFDGSMSQKARAAVLTAFADAPNAVVLLLSLRAGGVGLNLTHAKRVFMMDPWWSFAVEAQAIDRVHRMGQQDPVEVYRFIVRDSVEMRMLKIQDRKKFIASSLGMMSDEEKKVQRIEDIRELLS